MPRIDQPTQLRTPDQQNEPLLEKSRTSRAYKAALLASFGLLAYSIAYTTDTLSIPFNQNAADTTPARMRPNDALMQAVLGQLVEQNGGIACPDRDFGDTQVHIGGKNSTYVLCLDFRKTVVSTENVSFSAEKEPDTSFIVPMAAVKLTDLTTEKPSAVNIAGTYEIDPDTSNKDCEALTTSSRNHLSRILETADPQYHYPFRIVLDIALSSRCDEQTALPNKL